MKVLIISHNPICTYTNIGKTLDSLFQSFDKKELCQLYFYNSLPDKKKSNSYYRITDFEMLYHPFKKNKGMIVEDADINEGFNKNVNNFELYKLGYNKSSLKILMRDLMWRLCGWNSKKLKEWIKREKPTHLFVLPGRFKFIYRIALEISKEFDLPIITYICDDFYFVNNPKRLLDKIYLKKLKKQTKLLLKQTKVLITISKELSESFEKEFNVKATTIMTGTNYHISNKPNEHKIISAIRYFGNISYKRYESLYEIGVALDDINQQCGLNVSLEVYSVEKIQEAVQLFEKTSSIVFKGFESGEAFYNLLLNSPIVVHVESFDPKNIDIVKHSVSTKIADSLSLGNCLFAYGPDCVSSISHLKRNGYPLVATNNSMMKKELARILVDDIYWKECADIALSIANKYHDSQKTSSIFKKIVSEI